MIKKSMFTIGSMILTCILTVSITYNYLTAFNDGTKRLQKIGYDQCVDMNDKNKITLRAKIMVKQLRDEADRLIKNLSLIDDTPIPSKAEWRKAKRSLGGS